MNRNDNGNKVPGRKGAVARLVVMGLVSVIGVISAAASFPGMLVDRGFFPALWEAVGGLGVILMLAAWFWGLMKWVVVVFPKSFGAANRFWCCWEPLTFLGLYIKGCLWLIIGMVPVMLYGYSFSALFHLTLHFAKNSIGFFGATFLLAAGVCLVAVLGFWDVCRFRGVAPVQTLRQKLAKGM